MSTKTRSAGSRVAYAMPLGVIRKPGWPFSCARTLRLPAVPLFRPDAAIRAVASSRAWRETGESDESDIGHLRKQFAKAVAACRASAALGDDDRHQACRGDVEGRVADRFPRRNQANLARLPVRVNAFDDSQFVAFALFDRNAVAIDAIEVD